MLDLVFFGISKNYRRRISKDPSIPGMEDHARRMFKALELAGASSTVRASFIRAKFLYQKALDRRYTLALTKESSANHPNFERCGTLTFPCRS
jgi:hypothetical protein